MAGTLQLNYTMVRKEREIKKRGLSQCKIFLTIHNDSGNLKCERIETLFSYHRKLCACVCVCERERVSDCMCVCALTQSHQLT